MESSTHYTMAHLRRMARGLVPNGHKLLNWGVRVTNEGTQLVATIVSRYSDWMGERTIRL